MSLKSVVYRLLIYKGNSTNCCFSIYLLGWETLVINEQKAIAVIEHIAYHKLDERYDASIFSAHELRGRIGIDAIRSEKSLYDLVVVDSQGVEKRFAEDRERQEVVEVYTKLPRGFYINTPVGKYNPD